MSSATGSTPALPAPGTPSEGVLATVGRGLLEGVRGLAFWAAVLLPFVVLVTLTGVVTVEPWIVAALVGLNAACAVVGHSYHR